MLPALFRAARLIQRNRELAGSLGLEPDWRRSPEGFEVLSGQRMAGRSEPIALARARHQFGSVVPQRGDGRAVPPDEGVASDGRGRDIQMKEAGRTAFSHQGDGRATLGSVLRGYVASEARTAPGIPTTRALAAIPTGEPAIRDKVLPGTVLTRIAPSHVRIGTLQHFAAPGDTEGVRRLADPVLARHYPEAASRSGPIARSSMRSSRGRPT